VTGYNQQALDILNKYESKQYMNTVQSKAVLQTLIADALKQRYQQGCIDQQLISEGK